MKGGLVLCMVVAWCLCESASDAMPELVLYCPDTGCNATKLSGVFSIRLVNDSLHDSGLYSTGLGFHNKNEASLYLYENLEVLPQAFQLTEELLGRLKASHYNHSIRLGVLNGSMPEHREFFKTLMSVSPDVGYLDIDKQFELAVSLEVYRRHCPTIIAYNPESGELWLTYIKFAGNSTVDTPRIRQLLKDLEEGRIKSIKQGLRNALTKFTNWNYFYNNFHFMSNYVLGAISMVFVLSILFSEEKTFGFIKSKKKPAKEVGNEKKAK
eukprot:TRINITY_DN17007_c0_g2_i1.p1 TRINITY_DN17007_c0_g2~~TRINITY_DN17007_c0_g2_i1.p1  ORF type:complete len:292 (+),score=19.08 TRINITY_DN17007_c0_g2_i1:75-878(+)